MTAQKLFTFFIDSSKTLIRLDHFLAQNLPQWSRATWQHQIQAGLVTVNGSAVKSSHLLANNETVVAEAPVPQNSSLIPDCDLVLNIIFSDEDIVIINKPPNLVVHPGAGTTESTLVHGLLARFPQLAQVKGSNRPGIVHRLDKNTSGLMVVALNDIACQALVKQFSTHSILRGYLFLCHGELPTRGTIQTPIARHPVTRKKMATVAWGKPSITHFVALRTEQNITLGAARLGSGRTHQVRVHLASIGHPLVGDDTYGGKPLGSLKRQALHSALLEIIHPTTGKPMRWELPLPSDMVRAWRGTTGGEEPPHMNWELLE